MPSVWQSELALLLALVLPFLASAGGAGSRLRPDLRTLKIRDVRVGPDGSGRELRFSNAVENGGPGVLQVDPRDAGDCDGDGDPSNDRTANQRLYRDANGDGAFGSGVDKAYNSVPAGCMVFHPTHDHWHFNDFARYKLRSERTGERVAVSTKVSFCMRDSSRSSPSIPGSPPRVQFDGCAPDRTMGISVGWNDVYGAELPDQDLDITGLSPGPYCLSSVADPDDRLVESEESNNARRIRLKLGASSVALPERSCSSRDGGP